MSDKEEESGSDREEEVDKDKDSGDGDDGDSDNETKKKLTSLLSKQKDEKKKRPKLKAGDYIIQVHIIEARDLKGRGMGDMSDPVVIVEVMKQKKSTQIKKQCLSCVFDQVLTFEFPKLEPVEILQAKVKITVKDANTFRRDAVIGSYEFDCAHIYYSDHHEIHRSWLALSDLTDKHEGIQGYLRTSVVVLGPDDEQKIWDEEEEDEDEDNMLCVLMPPQIEQKGKLLKVQVYEAADLIEMDENRLARHRCDPYPLVEFAGVKVKSKHFKGTTVTINRQLNVPVMEPIMGSNIKFQFYDHDTASKDDLIATSSFDYDLIKEMGRLPPHWVNFYGAPRSKQKGEAKKMNRGFKEASTFRGRALVAVEIEDEDEPKKGVSEISSCDEKEMPRMEQYIVQMDMYEGSEIHKQKFHPDMHIELAIGAAMHKTERVPVKDNRCQWYQTIGPDGGDIALNLPADLDQCPDVFVYLCNKSTRLCFTRYTFREIVERGWGVPPTWALLNEDKALDKLDDDVFPGSLLYSLRAGTAATRPRTPLPESRPFASAQSYSKLTVPGAAATSSPEPEQKTLSRYDSFSVLDTSADSQETTSLLAPQESAPILVTGTLTLTIIEGSGLPAADSGGTSDPYVRMKLIDINGKELRQKTRVVKKTLSPKWNETFSFPDVSVDQMVAFKVYDHDRFGTDDSLGKFSFRIRTQSDQPAGKDFQVDSWFLVNDKIPDAKIKLQTKFHFHAAKVDPNARKPTMKKPLSSMKSLFTSSPDKSKVDRSHANYFGEPPRKNYQIRCFIYQCRNIIAADRSGLSDPYVVVRCCGKKVKSQIKKETLNAEWYETLILNVSLPFPFQLAPDILVSVYDWDNMSKDDLLGRMRIPVASAAAMNADLHAPQLADPKWKKLRNADNEVTQGELLLSFMVVPAAESHIAVPLSLVPPFEDKWLQIVTLGVRELNSVFGVNKPYVEFKLPSGKMYITNSSRTPNPANANFQQILKFPVRLPLNRLYAPVMALNVRDSIMGGIIKRRIGTANLSLDRYMPGFDEWQEQYLEDREKNGQSLTDQEKEALKAYRAKREEEELARLKKELAEREAREEAERLAAEKRRKEAEQAERERKIRAETDARVQAIQKEAEAAGHTVSRRSSKAPSQGNAQAGEEKVDLLSSHQRTTSKEDFLPVGKDALSHPSGLGDKEAISMDNLESKRNGKSEDVRIDILDEKESEETPSVEEKTKKKKKKSKGKNGASALDEAPQEEKEGKAAEDEKAPLLGQFDDELQDGYDASEEKDAAGDDDILDMPKYMIGRSKYDDELEDIIEMNPFAETPLFTGQQNASKLVGSKFRKVGAFKGVVKVTDTKDSDIGLNTSEILQSHSLMLRVYILKAHRLTPTDSDGTCDPFLKLTIGKTKISTRERRINNTLEPEFWEAFEIPCTIPGDAKLNIKVMDWDGIGDDLVGSTTIDIEDRWFTDEWRQLEKKPVERRTLHNPSSSFAQGKLEMWVDILTLTQAKTRPMINIKPPPPSPYELRVIVWGCRDITIKDTVTNQNDLYITGALDIEGLKKQKTDTHLRSKGGLGNFNWRMKFPVDLPMKRPARFRLQIWDMDFFSPNDSICEATLSLKGLFKRAHRRKQSVVMRKKGKDKIWIENLRHPNYEGNQGRVQISVEVLPKDAADQVPAGLGRSEPNMNPHLPAPEGRMIWTINPFTMFRQILGNRLYFKCCLIFWGLIASVLLIWLMPSVFGSAFGNIITGG